MPHSLVAKLSGLKHKGFITEAEYDRLKKALNSLRIDEMYQLEMENAEEFIAKSVLDKIRAEIEEQKEHRCFDDDDMYIYKTGLNDAIDIIDKYKADSEIEEDRDKK
jgi:predicted transcriptional regulator